MSSNALCLCERNAKDRNVPTSYSLFNRSLTGSQRVHRAQREVKLSTKVVAHNAPFRKYSMEHLIGRIGEPIRQWHDEIKVSFQKMIMKQMRRHDFKTMRELQLMEPIA